LGPKSNQINKYENQIEIHIIAYMCHHIRLTRVTFINVTRVINILKNEKKRENDT